jgi:hypothetical protein
MANAILLGRSMATPLVTVALAETQVSCPESLTPLPIIDE